jgi:hypothetical protein
VSVAAFVCSRWRWCQRETQPFAPSI